MKGFEKKAGLPENLQKKTRHQAGKSLLNNEEISKTCLFSFF